VVAKTSVVAGDRLYDRYSLNVGAGHYEVTASNWPQIRRSVDVRQGHTTVVTFPDVCK
jgi:hypothetical protein